MDARKPWNAFYDRKINSFNGKNNFNIPRKTGGSNQPYSEHYNDYYSEEYSEAYGEYSAPLGSGVSRRQSDVSYQGYPKQPAVQPRAPWKQKPTGCICCCPAHEGRMCATLAAALPGLMGGARGQSGTMTKPFFQFPVGNNSTAAPFLPNFNTTDPVQKAVIKHTFGGRAARDGKRKRPIRCDVCKIIFNSDSQAQAHYQGSRHAKKLKNQELEPLVKMAAKGSGPAPPAALGPAPPTASGAAPLTANVTSPKTVAGALPTLDQEAEQARKLLYCSLCKVSVNSLMQLDAHNSGGKHKTMLDARSGSGFIKAFPRAGVKVKAEGGAIAAAAVAAAPAAPIPKGSGLQNKTFQCQTCNIHVNSEIQLKQHISSRRHKDRAAGKPTKPKFTKNQQAEVTADGSSLGSSPDFRPAPGPIRTSRDAALFSPY
ncbi:zinc finger protein 385B isoform X1 [Corythoichthys intestinalis]|uniref:zinc finger protein 385B isoform X1 n=1 Tax=Corythoichthys intestinalis TaxID=161448 RepID=UPI0025A5C69E|nr:zinc finger protein 385B isoform X1 [Corythoichthys intestinalis]